MNLLLAAKRCAEAIPEPLGPVLSRIPFSWRLGPAYSRSRRELQAFERTSLEARRSFIFSRVKRIVDYAVANTRFYRDFYARHRFHPDTLRRFQDLARIPIVTKADLKQYDLAARSAPHAGRLLGNTGGTSGEPLDFYLHRSTFAKEWAHMHFIWSRLGYRPTDRKLTFRGKNLGNRPLQYNAVHNEYLVNAYADPLEVLEAVRRVLARQTIRFLHGYPSTVYEFVRGCDSHAPDLLGSLRATLAGVFLGSEYPAPVYRNTIAEKLGIPILSWYGHSEMAILAYETQPYLYVPFQNYGYCEAVPDDDGTYRLVGTAYDNVASPFIRYDTGDRILPADEECPPRGFHIQAGRVGEAVLDRHGHRISLTALVFGRHHALFRYARFVQIHQDHPGEATILVTVPPGMEISPVEVANHFDQQNVAIRLQFELLREPIRTPAGKVPLLVRNRQVQAEQEEGHSRAA